MTRTPIHGRVFLTNENVDRIIAVAAKRKFTIEHLRDSISYNAEDGFGTILFTSVYPWIPQISNFNDVAYDHAMVTDVPLMTTDEFIALLETVPES